MTTFNQEGQQVHGVQANVGGAERRPQFTREELGKRFGFHPAHSQERRDSHEFIRDVCLDAAVNLSSIVPAGRELSVVVTKLEEAMFWANAGLARSPDVKADQS